MLNFKYLRNLIDFTLSYMCYKSVIHYFIKIIFRLWFNFLLMFHKKLYLAKVVIEHKAQKNLTWNKFFLEMWLNRVNFVIQNKKTDEIKNQ